MNCCVCYLVLAPRLKCRSIRPPYRHTLTYKNRWLNNFVWNLIEVSVSTHGLYLSFPPSGTVQVVSEGGILNAWGWEGEEVTKTTLLMVYYFRTYSLVMARRDPSSYDFFFAFEFLSFHLTQSPPFSPLFFFFSLLSLSLGLDVDNSTTRSNARIFFNVIRLRGHPSADTAHVGPLFRVLGGKMWSYVVRVSHTVVI